MFWLLFFSQNTIMFEKVLLFPKIPQKMAVFQDVYDYHLILGEKQRLKQMKKSSLIPQPSSNTHQTYERAMIREVLRVLSLFYNFSMIKPPLDLFPQGLKIQIRVIVMFRVSTQLFLPITSQNLSKIQNSISEDYASLQ